MAKHIKRSNIMRHLNDYRVNLRDIVFLYMQMDQKNPLSKLVQMHAKKFEVIDEVKWVRMGLILGIIVHLQEKIVYVLPEEIKLTDRLINRDKYIRKVWKEDSDKN